MDEVYNFVSGRAISENPLNFSGLPNTILSKIPAELGTLFFIVFHAITIVSYVLFAFFSAKYLARKNIFGLNLNQYNKSNHPLLSKIYRLFLYTIEYLVILPAFIILWFYLLAAFLSLFLAGTSASLILLMAATLTVSIRILTYINEGIAHDVSKVVLLVFIAFSIISPQFSNINATIFVISQIPSILNHILYYLVFVLLLEFLMRIIYITYTFIKGENLYVNFYIAPKHEIFKSS